MIEQLLEPFRFEFFVNGLVVATVAGGLCGLIGVYVVLRGMSYIGHGLSHAIFGGFAASTILQLNFFLGAGAWGLASALMINRVARRRIIGADAAIGVITTASFALGLALLALFGSTGRDFDAALFGSVLGVDQIDVAAVVAVALLAVAFVFFAYRRLLFATFDPEVAGVSGVQTARVDALLMLVLAASVLVTMRVLGVTLIAATLVIPATVARMLTDSFHRMLALSTLIGTLSGCVGMVASYHLDIQSGPAIVLTSTLAFGMAFIATSLRTRARLARVDVVTAATAHAAALAPSPSAAPLLSLPEAAVEVRSPPQRSR
ncbi:MAG TPA: metal ABC transporter permease [Nitriliruptorales bacterium]|nr:metal ABC transporter permease [Nitriliruptorales bacterium]